MTAVVNTEARRTVGATGLNQSTHKYTMTEIKKATARLSALQVYILHELVDAGGEMTWEGHPLAQLAGAAKALVALQRARLVTTVGRRLYALTPLGRQAVPYLPSVERAVHDNIKYVRILQNALLTRNTDEEGYLSRTVLLTGVSPDNRAGFGLLNVLTTMGFLEWSDRYTGCRLTNRGKAFRKHLFTPDEFEAIVYFGTIGLNVPAVWVPRPNGRTTRIARNPLFNLSRPHNIPKATVERLVKRGLVEAGPDDTYRARPRAVVLVQPQRPPLTEEQRIWNGLSAVRREALLIGQTDDTEFARADLDALVEEGLLRRYDCGAWGYTDCYRRTALGEAVLSAGLGGVA